MRERERVNVSSTFAPNNLCLPGRKSIEWTPTNRHFGKTTYNFILQAWVEYELIEQQYIL